MKWPFKYDFFSQPEDVHSGDIGHGLIRGDRDRQCAENARASAQIKTLMGNPRAHRSAERKEYEMHGLLGNQTTYANRQMIGDGLDTKQPEAQLADVPAKLGDLSFALDRLTEDLHGLLSRLQPVVEQSTSNSTCGATTAVDREGGKCYLSNELIAQTERIRTLRNEVIYTLEKIQL